MYVNYTKSGSYIIVPFSYGGHIKPVIYLFNELDDAVLRGDIKHLDVLDELLLALALHRAAQDQEEDTGQLFFGAIFKLIDFNILETCIIIIM